MRRVLLALCVLTLMPLQNVCFALSDVLDQSAIAAIETDLHHRFSTIKLEALCPEAHFEDLEWVGFTNTQRIKDATRYCIIKGRSDTRFAPHESINRAEMAKIIAVAFGVPPAQNIRPFHDVDSNAWYAPYVYSLKQAGIVEGYADGSFRPDATITQAEMLKIVFTATYSGTTYIKELQNILSASHGDWFTPYTLLWDENYRISLSEASSSLSAHHKLNREEAVEILLTVLQRSQLDNSKELAEFAGRLKVASQTGSDFGGNLAQTLPIPTASEPHLGLDETPLSIITYVSFGDPYIVRLYPTLLALLDENKADMNLVIRYYPLPAFEPMDTLQASAFQCTWELGTHTQAFNFFQSSLGNVDEDAVTKMKLADKAVALGLDRDAFLDCANATATAKKINDSYISGAGNGVNGAPVSFVYHRQTQAYVMVPGAVGIEKFRDAIEKVRKF